MFTDKPGDHILVCVEGIDGAGKSTLVANISRRLEVLRGRGTPDYVVDVIAYPGRTKICNALRELVLERKYGNPDPRTEFLLFTALDCETTQTQLMPILSGPSEPLHIILCDRYWFSKFAYQQFENYSNDLSLLEQDLSPFYLKHPVWPRPDLVLYANLDPAGALERLKLRGKGEDKYDSATYEDYVTLQNLFECSFELYYDGPVEVLDMRRHEHDLAILGARAILDLTGNP